MFAFRSLVIAALFAGLARADGPKDNLPDSVRPIPPKGIEVPKETREKLLKQLEHSELQWELTKILLKQKQQTDLLELEPDVKVFFRAVEQASFLNEFHTPKEIDAAQKLLDIGFQRMKELGEGKPSWLTATGPVVRGYRSKIDGSVQPYGMYVPESFSKDAKTKRRLDFWWHGRGETLSENNFITGMLKSTPQFTPENAFVLQPYGRYSNANKFAGEVDTFECLEHAKKFYPIDETRLVARGFSMGGAACWQFATHFPTLWCAANPGAGFAETPEFLNVFQNEKVEPTWYEKKLWHMYNATDYAQNIFNLPTVAYSGEIDRQKQAADVMAREMKKVGLDLTHIIGPKTGHSYEKGAKVEVAKRIDEIVAKGKEEYPTEIKFVTYTLRYNWCSWISVQGLAKHWDKATVNGSMTTGKDGRKTITLKTSGVTAIIVRAPAGPAARITIDGQEVRATYAEGKEQILGFEKALKDGGKWIALGSEDPDPPLGTTIVTTRLAKIPGLQGPIDDAFMDSFLMVLPTGKCASEDVERFVFNETMHAREHWQKHFRGNAPVKEDKDVTDKDIAENNLILWGDPRSNAVLAKIADKLPIKWHPLIGVEIGDKKYSAVNHVPVMIYPNPLNPKKYVVLNSGFTFREYAYLNNARQVPMLPDYAIVDVTTPPNSRYPGKIVQAGFFGEKWELLPNDGQ